MPRTLVEDHEGTTTIQDLETDTLAFYNAIKLERVHEYCQSSLDDDSIFWDSAQVVCDSQFGSVEQVSSAGTMVNVLGRFQGGNSMQISISEDWLDLFI